MGNTVAEDYTPYRGTCVMALEIQPISKSALIQAVEYSEVEFQPRLSGSPSTRTTPLPIHQSPQNECDGTATATFRVLLSQRSKFRLSNRIMFEPQRESTMGGSPIHMQPGRRPSRRDKPRDT